MTYYEDPVYPQPWSVKCVPEEGNHVGESGKNEGSLIVFVTNGQLSREVGRVAFNRKNSSNPRVKFADQLRRVMNTAGVSAEAVSTANLKAYYAECEAVAERRRATAAAEEAMAREDEGGLQ